jgi:hypothetical protein
VLALIGFLAFGQATDWKVISRSPRKVTAATRFGTPETSIDSARVALLRAVPAQRAATRHDKAEQVVDRGDSSANSSQLEGELD